MTATLIPRADAQRVVWGDDESGQVPDVIYLSNERIHIIEFSLERGGRFTHSEVKRTVFGADEVFYVLEGSLILANPEVGEVHRLRQGEAAFFRRNTWHHGFAHDGPVRILEFMAPPPSAGTTQPYARTRPLLTESLYANDEWLGRWPMDRDKFRPTMTVLGPNDRIWRLADSAGQVLLGVVASTEHLTVVEGLIEADGTATFGPMPGDIAIYVLAGDLLVEDEGGPVVGVAGDVIHVGAGISFSCRSETGAHVLAGLAPTFAEGGQ